MRLVHLAATHLDKIGKALFTSRAGETTIVHMDCHVILQQIQAVKGLGTENARVGLLVYVKFHMTLQGSAADEAFIADVTRQRAIAFMPMEA